jgi:magnesium-transporting ATPase (P-type)
LTELRNQFLLFSNPSVYAAAEYATILLLFLPHTCRLFIWILFIAAVVSAGLQAWADMGLILGVVVINVGIGLFQEGKAEKVRVLLRQRRV